MIDRLRVHRHGWLAMVLALGLGVGAALPAGARAPAAPGAVPKVAAAREPGAGEPGAGDAAVVREQVLARLAGMTVEDKVGQLFMTYAYGQSATDPDPAMVSANQRDYGVDNAAQLIDRYHPGGIIYFAWSGNTREPHQVAALSNGVQQAARRQPTPVPLLIATDQEQGLVTRIGPPATQFPGSMALGAARSTGLAAAAARITGRELWAMGVNQDLAPVADVNVNPQNPVIGVRSFGSEPGLAAGMVGAQVRALQAAGVAATAKHFPGHGDTSTDSHTGLPVIGHTMAELERIDLPPFRAAIAAGVQAIMTAHIVVPALDPSGRPATLSEPILTGLLRQRLGFDGVIITDALDMAGVRQLFGDERVPVEALKAGADMLLMPPPGTFDLQYRSVLGAMRSGEIPQARLDRSVYRILRLKLRLGLFGQPPPPGAVDRLVGTPAHLAVADRASDRTVTLVKNDAGTLPLEADSSRRVLVTGWGVTTTATLGQRIAERGMTTQVLATGSAPSETTIAAAAAAAAQSDLVVATTQKAWSDPGQQRLVQALLASGRPLVVAAVGDPYDIAYFPRAPTYLATYSFQPVSLAALARVLFGEVGPSGRLPVTIPVAGQPEQTLYPFGHGLRY